jgi:HEAT repeat protein
VSDEPALYHPASDFLMVVLNEEAPLSGSPHGDANLALLIDLTRDVDKSNRDWAVFILAQTEFDTPEIRVAFKHALGDEDEDVRAEALVGIAKRDPAFALPHVLSQLEKLLEAGWFDEFVLEAAGYVADPTLLPALRAIRDQFQNIDNEVMAGMYLKEALESCATAIQPQWRDFDD